MKALRIAGAIQYGEADPASHAKPEDNGGQKYHQGKMCIRDRINELRVCKLGRSTVIIK